MFPKLTIIVYTTMTAVFFAAPVFAQDHAPVAAAFEDALLAWAKDHNIAEASMAVGYDGKVIGQVGLGRDPDTPYPIASLSKAVTATCMHQVLQDAGLDYDVTLGRLTEPLGRVGLSISQDALDIKLSDLASMSAGLSPDITQGTFNRNRAYGDTRNIAFSRRALADDARRGEVGAHFYNNGNYAILGAVIEALSGTDNVTACADHILNPAGVTTAAFSADWIALAAFGGWEMSATDYLRFVMTTFAPDGPFAEDVFDHPHIRLPAGAFYGLGSYFRTRNNRVIFWHFGTLCLNNNRDTGAYFAYYENGYAVSVNYSTCLSDTASRELDYALWTAGHP